MARNRYSQTSPLEAFSALGQGLQGLAQAMDVSAQQKREMLGNQALSMALGSLANPEVRVDAETYMEKVNNLAGAFQKIGLNPLQFYQMALQTVPKTKKEQERATKEAEYLSQQTRGVAISADIAEQTKDFTITEAKSRATIAEKEAEKAGEKIQAGIDLVQQQIAESKKQVEYLGERIKTEVGSRPYLIDRLTLGVAQDIQSLNKGDIEIEQMQDVYSPKMFQDILVELYKPPKDFMGNPIEETAVMYDQRMKSIAAIEGVAAQLGYKIADESLMWYSKLSPEDKAAVDGAISKGATLKAIHAKYGKK